MLFLFFLLKHESVPSSLSYFPSIHSQGKVLFLSGRFLQDKQLVDIKEQVSQGDLQTSSRQSICYTDNSLLYISNSSIIPSNAP